MHALFSSESSEKVEAYVGLEAIVRLFLISIFDEHLNETAISVVLAGFCKQQLGVFSMDVAIQNDIVKVSVEGEYAQFSIVAAASAFWEN